MGEIGLCSVVAAHALSQQAPLVTNNTREFAMVPELRLENWVP
jgi:tRNA(fMet)-specific endonuclease VapC